MSTDVSASPSLSQQDDGPLAHTRPILAVPALTGYFNALHPMNPEHERVQALGGPYQSSCDYRAEILGHMKTNQRCFICLCIRNSAGAPVDSKPHRQWGILFCSGCLKDYSIGGCLTNCINTPVANDVLAAGIVRKVVPVAGILDSTSLPSFTTGSTQYYYLPEVDEILRSHTGLDVKIALMSHNRVLQQKEKARVQASNLERQRRIIRQQIVLFAQRLWEGEDPAPEEVIDVRTGKVIAFEPRKTLTSPELYQCFRERFAPTAKLKEFLFPEHLLDIRPTDLPYNPLGGWLQDPTKKLRSFVTADNMSNRYVSDCAEKMLHCLTNWRDPLYYRKGMGGYVDSWMNAAKQYHINRLEAELASGLTVNMGYIPTDCHGNSQFARLRRLRAKCGLQKLDSVHMDQVPKRPEREPLSASYPLYEYIRRDQAVARAETKRAEGIKYFNKIIRETTTTCPSTALLFYPMGLEGLVEHMRVGHGDVFWQSDDFHVSIPYLD